MADFRALPRALVLVRSSARSLRAGCAAVDRAAAAVLTHGVALDDDEASFDEVDRDLAVLQEAAFALGARCDALRAARQARREAAYAASQGEAWPPPQG